jgi:hypothetical protein
MVHDVRYVELNTVHFTYLTGMFAVWDKNGPELRGQRSREPESQANVKR